MYWNQLDTVQAIVNIKQRAETKQKEESLEELIRIDPDKVAFGQDEIGVLLPGGVLSDLYDTKDYP